MPDTIDDAQEHPIIFNEWSIQRILAGEKTQTRRVVKPQPDGPVKTAEQARDESWYWVPLHGTAQTAPGEAFCCPYGQPGDVLWVREAFRLPVGFGDDSPTEAICTKDCDSEEECNGDCHAWKFEADSQIVGPESGLARTIANWGGKRRSTHMPRELCRIRLRVKDVRVEQVHSLGGLDAFREGLVHEQGYGWNAPDHSSVGYESHDGAFAALWNDIHGDGAWGRNEWVWVIEFARYDE